ncbi:MAG: Rieske 2Fe-2S domain-containing protein [Actinobacteria bacterium]|nr:Rieske 2Fe-2S domain-containing protein [Actinomycetota bacterium]
MSAAIPVPRDCWYAPAASSEVGRELVPVRAAGLPVVLYRTESGAVVALEDRCAHRAYPLSAGELIGDTVRCGLCGFVYGPDGQCISVPTQPHVPYGARVASYPVQEADGLVWVWLGEPGRAGLHRIPDLPWLDDDGWSTVSGEEDVLASFLLLHENFADVTQVPFVAPDIAPSVLGSTPPPLEVVVSETSVSLHRDFPPAPLPEWQAEIVGCPPDAPYRTEQSGFFPSPAVWVDHWDAQAADGTWIRLRFTHLVTPIDESSSRLLWAVSRDFALGNRAVDQYLGGIFTDYYERVIDAMEIAQEVLEIDGPGPEVNVNADAVGLKVREIVDALLTAEGA